MELSSNQVVTLSRSLLASFVTLLTCWYFISPYLVTASPKFEIHMNQMIQDNSEINENREDLRLENWTKWRLYLFQSTGEKIKVYPNMQLSITNLTFPIHAEFEWRPEYSVEIERNVGDNLGLSVALNKPWYGEFGLYNHFHHQIDGLTLRLIPSFMFGVPQHVLDKMYGGSANIPSNGILSSSTDQDRIMIQCFMNLVVLSVIFLLWANNPVQKKVAVD